MGAWVFGCDLCQDVCPWNRKVPATEEPEFQPLNENNPLDLIELFDLDDEGFRKRFRRTPLWRSKRRGLLRNAAIALGNRPTPAAFDVLSRGLNDDESLVRGACAWALAHYDPPAACRVLQERLTIEQDLQVREEISWSLRQLK